MRSLIKNLCLGGMAANAFLIAYDLHAAIRFSGGSLEHVFMALLALAAFSFVCCFIGYWSNRDSR